MRPRASSPFHYTQVFSINKMPNLKNKYIISIDDCIERRLKLIEAGFPSDDVKSYFRASDTRNIDIKNLRNTDQLSEFKHFYNRYPKCGEIGCLESHLRVYRSFLDTDEIVCAIFEDDNIIANNLNFEIINYILNAAQEINKKNKAFIINLGLPQNQISNSITQRVFFKNNQPSIQFLRVLHTHGGIWRTNAYIINRKAALNMLSHKLSKILLADDWSLRKKTGIIDEIFIPKFPIFSQDNTIQTTIQIPDVNALLLNSGPVIKNSLNFRIINSINFRLNTIINKLHSTFSYNV